MPYYFQYDVDERECGEMCNDKPDCPGFVFRVQGPPTDRCFLKLYMCDEPDTNRIWTSYYKFKGLTGKRENYDSKCIILLVLNINSLQHTLEKIIRPKHGALKAWFGGSY